MGDDVVVSRRAWLVGLAGRAVGRVAEAVEDRIPEPLLPSQQAPVDEVVEDVVVAPEPIPTVLHLRDNRCIAMLGIDCGACARLCPDDVKGLWMERRKPVIDPDACVSCGACVEACPTSPVALELVPDPTAASAAPDPSASPPTGHVPAALDEDNPQLNEDEVAEVVVEPVRPDWSVSHDT